MRKAQSIEQTISVDKVDIIAARSKVGRESVGSLLQ